MAPPTIAIMQPYFIPYAGYFRLFAVSDLLVIYDCVQFARRGWVHRNRLPDRSGVERWLTLPLAKAPQSVLIKDLRFPEDAAALLDHRLHPSALDQQGSNAQPAQEQRCRQTSGTAADDQHWGVLVVLRHSLLLVLPVTAPNERATRVACASGGSFSMQHVLCIMPYMDYNPSRPSDAARAAFRRP